MISKIIFGLILSIEFVSMRTFGSPWKEEGDLDNWASEIAEVLNMPGCGTSPYDMTRIVGGTAASTGMYPWIVSMQILLNGRFHHACGASILNKRWMITAAQCFAEMYEPIRFRLVAGITDISESDDPRTNIYTASRIIVHPQYNNQTFANDIALIETVDPIAVENAFMGAICLPDHFNDPTGNAIVIGWGALGYGVELPSNVLMQVEVPIVDRRKCNLYYEKPKVLETNICAGIKDKDACQGDAGGPLFQIVDGVAVLIGIVSFGTGCGENPSVHAKVSSYLPWMKDTMFY